MPLSSGTRLGPYEIQAAIGAGGMGEVYKARDTRLDRSVAIKVLPAQFSADADRRARFEREAKTIAGLNHPHICTLYDVGEHEGSTFLVMEHLTGETLAQRLQKGALPLERALTVATEIADALAAAHRQGVIHRDLKPGNVMLTKTGAKLLDFGLAKLKGYGEKPAAAHLASAPTQSTPLTGEGMIVGTLQYMAPEQVEGRPADARTDLWALGTILYEMVTGKRAFEGTSAASLIGAIMTTEPPPLPSVQRLAPAALDHVVRMCLAKAPEDRVQTAHDILLQLRWIVEGSQVEVPRPVAVRRKNRERLAWAIAALALVVAAGLGFIQARSVPAPQLAARVVRSTILLPERVGLNNAVISPDGSRIVFSGTDATGRTQLWVRALDADAATPLAGTEGGLLPFWSPDGRSIGFFADQKLKRIEASGGAPLVLYDVDGLGGAWAPNGDILFTPPTGPVFRVPAAGGRATAVTTLNASRGETGHRYPFMLPDGRHFLYLALKLAGSRKDPANQIWVGSLDGDAAQPVLAANSNAQYADGYLLFIRGGAQGGSLLAQPFDPVRLETRGVPITVAEYVALYGYVLHFGCFSVAGNGTLVFNASQLLTRLEWYDRTGKQVGVFGEPALHSEPRISPDGSRVAFNVYDAGSQTTQVWVGDLTRGVETRLTSAPSSNATPVWSPDGARVAFQSDRKHQADVYVRSVDATGTDEAITDEDGQKIPTDWSSDGRLLAVTDRNPGGDRKVGVSAIPLDGNRRPLVVVPRMADSVGTARLSPDGRWLLYDTDESGRQEIFVVSFPAGRGKVQVSNAGGVGARWSRGGREVVYVDFDRKVMAVAVDTTNGFRAGAPSPLFQLPEGAGSWDLSSDGQRFLVNVPVIKSSSVPLSLVVNWAATLRR